VQQNRTIQTPLPWLGPKKGFTWLPLSEQLVVLAGPALLILALLPMFIDPGRAAQGSLRPALQRPASMQVARQRLARHYHPADWITTAGERQLRLRLLALLAGASILGAAAGRAVHQPPTPPAKVKYYGTQTAKTMRARAALIPQEDDHAAPTL